jgi:sugar lactone lactonase YvrE
MRAVSESIDTLGESPVWAAREEALYWVDIRAPSLCRLDSAGAVKRWPMPDLIGAVMLRERGGLVIGLRTGLSAFDPQTGDIAPLAPVGESHAGNRINDSRCDRLGRIWFSTMWDFGRQRTGSLYCLNGDLRCERILDGLTVPNAISFSLSGERAYVADSAVGAIHVLEFDPETGAAGAPQVFVEAGVVPGKPDGATVDAEGFVWNARFGAGLLARFAPDGRVDRLVPLPVTNPTSCSFGGSDLATLFVTTATQGLDTQQRCEQPLAGAVLAFEPGVRGIVEPAFRG